MKKGYNDEHIIKQCEYYNNIKKIYLKEINIIKLENLDFNNILSNILNINIDIIKNTHYNKTDNIIIFKEMFKISEKCFYYKIYFL